MNIVERFLLVFLLCFSLAHSVLASEFPVRGMTADARITLEDLRAYKKAGGQTLRVSFANAPLAGTEKPYAINGDSFRVLDVLVKNSRDLGVKVILDPHSFPGVKGRYTTVPDDELWTSPDAQKAVVQLWELIARRYVNDSDVLVGYDLMNEPSIDLRPVRGQGKRSWNSLVAEIVKVVRGVDKDRILIIEPCTGFDKNGRWINRLEGMNYLDPVPDSNVVYSPHYYLPKEFTHQGVFKDFPVGVSYPGVIEGVFWDRDELKRRLLPVLDFQIRNKATIYVGEFGSSCWAGKGRQQYIRDLVNIFEELGWGWTYHAYRESFIWSPEREDARCFNTKNVMVRSEGGVLSDFLFEMIRLKK